MRVGRRGRVCGARGRILGPRRRRRNLVGGRSRIGEGRHGGLRWLFSFSELNWLLV